MHAFVQRLAQRIETAHPESIEFSLLDAVEIMRRWRFFDGDPGGSAVIGPFSESAEYPHVRADDVERLKQAFVKFIRDNPHHPQLGRALHGFQYLASPDTKGLLVEVLRDCLGRDSSPLYQAILALEALGENLYGPRLSTGYDEVERNEKVARAYLASLPTAT